MPGSAEYKMPDMKDKEQHELTFSQRVGKVDLPEILQAGRLPTKFRNMIWFVLDSSMDINSHTSKNAWMGPVPALQWKRTDEAKYWNKFIFSYHVNVLEKPHDEIKYDPSSVKIWLKELILKGDYHKVITLLEHMLRIKDIPDILIADMEHCMRFAPYFIDRSSKPICIAPKTSEEMRAVTEQLLDNISKSELSGAKTHLSNAKHALNNGNYAGSFRESTHAAEAAAEAAVKRIDLKKKSKPLPDALESLKSTGMIKHSAMKNAFANLYGYASDEVRHCTKMPPTNNVGLDEAILMYTTWVAFVDFLVRKQRQNENGEK